MLYGCGHHYDKQLCVCLCVCYRAVHLWEEIKDKIFCILLQNVFLLDAVNVCVVHKRSYTSFSPTQTHNGKRYTIKA